MATPIYGIDVSHHQGTIDFAKVKASGKKFVILKVSQGATFVDSKFETYYNDATKNGLAVGAYIYNKVYSVAEAEAEAKLAVKCLKGKKLAMGVWLDMEDKTMRVNSKSLLNSIIEKEASILKAEGFKVGIYCNLDWYKNVLDSSKLELTYKMWIARYPSGDNGTIKTNLRTSYMDAWQYSSKGKVNGIGGNVDLDILYDEELIGWVNGASTQTPQTPSSSTSTTTNGFPAVPFTVKILDDNLNIRTTPNGNKTGKQITDHGIYTIIKVSNGWGYLKSKVGWICISDKYVKVLG